MIAMEQAQQQQPGVPLRAALWALVYTFGVGYFLLGGMGLQSLTPEWHRESLPLYALVSFIGAVSGFAFLGRRRWGVYGLMVTWIASAILNRVYPRPLNLEASIGALALVIVFMLDIRQVWRFLT